jgi:hypothetical protein
MGTGVRCMWDATSKSGCCAGWCKAHADKWVKSVLAVLNAAPASSAIVLDFLCFSNLPGIFAGSSDKIEMLLGTDAAFDARELSARRVESLRVGVGVAKGSDAPACALFAKGTGKPDAYILTKDGAQTYIANAAECADALSRALQDVEDANMLFRFDASLGRWAPAEVRAMRGVLDILNLKAVSETGKRAYLIRGDESCPAGSVHVSLDCGGFVAHWHSLDRCLVSVDTFTNEIEISAAFSW